MSAASTLTRLGDSTLYASADKPTWVFLLWDTSNPPSSLPLEDTWSDHGAPPRPGWYVFVPTVPSPARAPERERALRDVLSAPVATGLVWSGDAGDGSDADLRGVVSVGLDEEERPLVLADASITLPPGLLAVGFQRGLRVAAQRGAAGQPDGLTATRPAYEELPWKGIEVVLTGELAGCITFAALLESAVDGDHSIKLGAEVCLDPLRPFDPRRTRTTPTGEAYALIAEQDQPDRLVPLSSAPGGDQA